MEESTIVQCFTDRVENFVRCSLEGYESERHDSDKSIRDAIWGTNQFYAWEIAILDSPLLQRLRDIHQTGLAYLVYPTAEHSRFDHTLGMVTVASRIVRSINDKYPLWKGQRISYPQHMSIRLSAILHDVGHSCFSHVSEKVYGSLDEFDALRRYVNCEYGVTPKPHEIMSWLIVRSRSFKDFIEELGSKGILKGWTCSTEDVDKIAENIIGHRKNPTEKFIADIINGPMDADKLDYLIRDAYFAGPTVVYDLERFLHTVDVIEYPRDSALGNKGENVTRLSIRMEGVTALEQIIISKLMMFSYVYHHHKIRCVEAMCHEAIISIVSTSRLKSEDKTSLWLGHPTAFLCASDRTLLPLVWPPEIRIKGDKVSKEILTMIAKRELYKRALVISRLFIQDIDEAGKEDRRRGFEELLKCSDDTRARELLRQQIYDRTKIIMRLKPYRSQTETLSKIFKVHHVYLDVPKAPSIEETVGVMVPVDQSQNKQDTSYVPLIDIFPIEKWVDAYNAIKWQGHVFTLEEAVPYVNAAARQVLSEKPFNLHFTPTATTSCKLKDKKGELVASQQ